MNHITEADIAAFRQSLAAKNLIDQSIKRYIGYVQAFAAWLDGLEVTQEHAEEFIRHISETREAVTVNAFRPALNSFFDFIGADIRLKYTKTKRYSEQQPTENPRKLTNDEYARLLGAAQLIEDMQMSLALQTICLAGLRVTELQYITVETARSGEARITTNGKKRTVSIPEVFGEKLLKYAKERGVMSGSVFVSAKGNPLHIKKIRKSIKKLSLLADMPVEKVYFRGDL